jgi:hypothetical protein
VKYRLGREQAGLFLFGIGKVEESHINQSLTNHVLFAEHFPTALTTAGVDCSMLIFVITHPLFASHQVDYTKTQTNPARVLGSQFFQKLQPQGELCDEQLGGTTNKAVK